MSSEVKLSGDAAGRIILQGNDTIAADQTFTFPDTGGEIATRTAGNILQVVSNSTTTEVTNTTVSYVDTGLSASITPTSSSSKILVIINQGCRWLRDTGDQGIGIKVLRDATEIYTPVSDNTGPFMFYQTVGSGTNSFFINAPFTLLDAPNTTNQITYKTQARPYTNGGNGMITCQTNGSTGSASSHIFLLEVAA